MKMHSRNKLLSEAATGRVLFKKILLKKIPKQMFCYKVFELFKNNYFEEHLQMNTSILFRNGEPQIKKDGDEDFNGWLWCAGNCGLIRTYLPRVSNFITKENIGLHGDGRMGTFGNMAGP